MKRSLSSSWNKNVANVQRVIIRININKFLAFLDSTPVFKGLLAGSWRSRGNCQLTVRERFASREHAASVGAGSQIREASKGSSNYMEIEQSRGRKGAKGWKWNNEDSKEKKGLRKA